MLSFPYPLKFKYNIRSEKSNSLTGYNWGVLSEKSDIIKNIANGQKKDLNSLLKELNISSDDIVSERWIVSDDQKYPSVVNFDAGFSRNFSDILREHALFMLGEDHLNIYGPFLSTIMKQINTSEKCPKGSLSVQVHPKEGIPGTVAKPEMWMGKGKIYLGWNQEVDREIIRKAIDDNDLESYMNAFDIDEDQLVTVPGGVVHATRFNTSFFEWSKSVTKEEFESGSLKKATYALYDRVDGKSPRPGKENFEEAVNIIEMCDGYGKADDFFGNSQQIYSDSKGNSVNSLFRTSAVQVEEIIINDSIATIFDNGWPFFVAAGELAVSFNGSETIFHQGEEGFIPASLKRLELINKSSGELKIFRWYPGKLKGILNT